MRRAGVIVLLALTAAGCGKAASPPAASAAGRTAVATDHVDLPRSYLFAPAAITVRAGTRVTFTNHDVFTHAVLLADSGSAPQVMKPGDSTSVVFATPGRHDYACPFHPQNMKGTVVVE